MSKFPWDHGRFEWLFYQNENFSLEVKITTMREFTLLGSADFLKPYLKI